MSISDRLAALGIETAGYMRWCADLRARAGDG